MVNEQLRCKHCTLVVQVSEEDPDASVADMVDHVVMRHGLSESRAIVAGFEIEWTD